MRSLARGDRLSAAVPKMLPAPVDFALTFNVTRARNGINWIQSSKLPANRSNSFLSWVPGPARFQRLTVQTPSKSPRSEMCAMAYKPALIPIDFNPIDATVEQVMTYRGESASKVFKKMRDGTYVSYVNGKRRMIVFASVKLDRDRCIARGPQFTVAVAHGVKRKLGRPRKVQPQPSAE